MADKTAELLSRLRSSQPLVHCISNQVAANFTANVLLAVGAVPAMVLAPEEVLHFSASADALCVNLGTLTGEQKRAIGLAVEGANGRNRPWVLDPVAVGQTLAFRTEFALELLQRGRPTAIRANASEILALARIEKANAAGRGPDTQIDSGKALHAAEEVASQLGPPSLVVLTGRRDFVCQKGRPTVSLGNGHSLMTKVTGVGCALSAMVAAFLAVAEPHEYPEACLAALAVAGVAGELAAEVADGPGSFTVAYLDRLSAMGREELQARMKMG